jgi:hypothetical protein
MQVAKHGAPNAISNAIGYAKFHSRSHDAVIRVYDEAGETHGPVQGVVSFYSHQHRTSGFNRVITRFTD